LSRANFWGHGRYCNIVAASKQFHYINTYCFQKNNGKERVLWLLVLTSFLRNQPNCGSAIKPQAWRRSKLRWLGADFSVRKLRFKLMSFLVRWVGGLNGTAGPTISQVVTRRLPIAAARVPAQVNLCAICGAQRGTGAGFLRVLRFALPILILPTAPHSSPSTRVIRGWYNRPISGRRTRWTQSHPTTIKKKWYWWKFIPGFLCFPLLMTLPPRLYTHVSPLLFLNYETPVTSQQVITFLVFPFGASSVWEITR
jgi:hypothetical protein